MASWIIRLWTGEFSLARSFWEFGIVCGSLIHLIMTGVALGSMVMGAPTWIALVLFLSPAPYTILVVVGVWRSAERYRGPAKWAQGARIMILIWALLATVL